MQRYKLAVTVVWRLQGRLGNRQEQCEALLAQGQPLQVRSAVGFAACYMFCSMLLAEFE